QHSIFFYLPVSTFSRAAKLLIQEMIQFIFFHLPIIVIFGKNIIRHEKMWLFYFGGRRRNACGVMRQGTSPAEGQLE
ncbi:MAG: hypothetical protein ACI4TM_04185, partial [Candidatus Cryptobacteroides sp.]